jgi:cytochrome c2
VNKQVGYITSAHLLLFSLAAGYFFFSKIAETPGYQQTTQSISIKEQAVTLSSEAAKGKQIFQTNCANCHHVFKRLVGPALKDFELRGPWSDRKQLYEWIRNPQSFLKENSYTQELKKEYVTVMTPFDFLKDAEIDQIVSYINETAGQAQ